MTSSRYVKEEENEERLEWYINSTKGLNLVEFVRDEIRSPNRHGIRST